MRGKKCSQKFDFCQTPLQLEKPNSTSVGLSRRKKKKNPHLASSRRIDPTCLNFGDCLVGVWKLSGGCLAGVWWVSGGCLVGVWWVSGGCLKGV